MKWLGFITFCVFVSIFSLVGITFQWAENHTASDITIVLTDDGAIAPESIEPAAGPSTNAQNFEQDALMSAPAFRNIEPAALRNEEDSYQKSLFPSAEKKAIEKSLKKEQELDALYQGKSFE